MVPVELDRIGAAFYAGNCHKWLCAPKGAGFLHVRRDRQAAIRPHVISHGANSPRRDRSRFRLEFDWTGTLDPSAYLSVPFAIDTLGSLLPGGWPELMARNRALALAGRERLCAALGCDVPAPAEMIGALASVPLPGGSGAEAMPIDPSGGRRSQNAALGYDPLQASLLERHRIQVPCFARPGTAQRIVRISAQLYNTIAEYERLAEVLPGALAADRRN
jgi:isopenicillin-N epimerase